MRSFFGIAIALVCLALLSDLATAQEVPMGPFPTHQCVSCHQKENPDVVAGWQASRHSQVEPVIDCVACHGKTHDPAVLSRARHNASCTNCHGVKAGAKMTL